MADTYIVWAAFAVEARNSSDAAQIIRKDAELNGMELIEIQRPFLDLTTDSRPGTGNGQPEEKAEADD